MEATKLSNELSVAKVINKLFRFLLATCWEPWFNRQPEFRLYPNIYTAILSERSLQGCLPDDLALGGRADKLSLLNNPHLIGMVEGVSIKWSLWTPLFSLTIPAFLTQLDFGSRVICFNLKNRDQLCLLFHKPSKKRSSFVQFLWWPSWPLGIHLWRFLKEIQDKTLPTNF
eukprot:Blabericola_migrator_1__712@NODE_1177_length_5203_cov_152_764213_g800_i0_p3_GENE_NODE_1177_length_5203_cov_152_764213_g800_i0NODE_1177_length_5203_cov_152_764213_g800_i0_p3_ORF_typecomplete_len171_score17_77_NODE_1177_length_5203_cov_152_764213_g800_i019402452